MTVRSLIEYLQTQPPEALVFEDREGELRELRREDISEESECRGLPIADIDMDDEDQPGLDLPAVIFGAWS